MLVGEPAAGPEVTPGDVPALFWFVWAKTWVDRSSAVATARIFPLMRFLPVMSLRGYSRKQRPGVAVPATGEDPIFPTPLHAGTAS